MGTHLFAGRIPTFSLPMMSPRSPLVLPAPSAGKAEKDAGTNLSGGCRVFASRFPLHLRLGLRIHCVAAM